MWQTLAETPNRGVTEPVEANSFSHAEPLTEKIGTPTHLPQTFDPKFVLFKRNVRMEQKLKERPANKQPTQNPSHGQTPIPNIIDDTLSWL